MKLISLLSSEFVIVISLLANEQKQTPIRRKTLKKEQQTSKREHPVVLLSHLEYQQIFLLCPCFFYSPMRCVSSDIYGIFCVKKSYFSNIKTCFCPLVRHILFILNFRREYDLNSRFTICIGGWIISRWWWRWATIGHRPSRTSSETFLDSCSMDGRGWFRPLFILSCQRSSLIISSMRFYHISSPFWVGTPHRYSPYVRGPQYVLIKLYSSSS